MKTWQTSLIIAGLLVGTFAAGCQSMQTTAYETCTDKSTGASSFVLIGSASSNSNTNTNTNTNVNGNKKAAIDSECLTIYKMEARERAVNSCEKLDNVCKQRLEFIQSGTIPTGSTQESDE